MSKVSDFPFVLANPRHRLAGIVVDGAFRLVTLGIGWFIWSMIVWAQGQTPGHQVLRMRVYSIDTGKPVTWGHMALRAFVLPLTFFLLPLALVISGGVIVAAGSNGGVILVAIGYLGMVAINLVDALWIFKGKERKRLVDVFARTVVLNECIPA